MKKMFSEQLWIQCVSVVFFLTSGLAWSQPSWVRDGSTLVVATAASGEALLLKNNGAVAMDAKGNVAIAYTRNSGANQQILRAVDPGGAVTDYLVAPISGSLVNSPIVGSFPGDLFALSYMGLNDQGESILLSDLVVLSASGATKISALSAADPAGSDLLGWRSTSLLRLETKLREQQNCAMRSWSYQNAEQSDVHFFDSTAEFAPLAAVSSPHKSGGYYLVNCSDDRNIFVYFDTSQPTPESTIITLSTASSASQSSHTPDTALPIVAVGTRSAGPIAIYAGSAQQAANPLVTVVELAYDGTGLEIGNVIQLADYPMTSDPGPVLASCGHEQGAEHYWVAYIDHQNQAILARLENGEVSYQTLGQSAGAIDIACDAWGNAVVAWWQQGSGHTIEVLALSANGGRVEQLSESLQGSPASVTVNMALNAAGQAVVVWALDDAEIAMRRFQLAGQMQIDGTLSGSHYSPFFNGEGFAMDIVELNGAPTLVLYYFTYQADGSGEMAWMVGSGPIIGNRAVVSIGAGAGASFGSDFEASLAVITPVGEVTVTFLSCRLALLETEASGFGSLRYIVTPLTDQPLAVQGQCGQGADGTAAVDASLGGSVFSATRNGEGFYFDIVQINGAPSLVIYYFTYLPDGSGKPAWLVGSGEIVGNQARVAVGFGSGASFGPDFDPSQVVITPWGTITVTWVSCTEMQIEYDGLWGAGSHSVGPLTVPLLGATGLCSTPLASTDHDVVIVGAGAAGLFAAFTLDNLGYDVLVLEASDRHGGRIGSSTLGTVRIELGAEELYGARNNFIFNDIEAVFGPGAHTEIYQGGSTQDELISMDGGATCWSWGDCDLDPDIAEFWRYYRHVGSHANDASDILVSEDLLINHGIDRSHRSYHLYDGSFPGGEFGAAITRLGLRSLARQDELWPLSGTVYGLGPSGYLEALNSLYFDQIIDRVMLNSPVVTIDTSGARAVAVDANGIHHYADAILVTVSLGVLQAEIIDFAPDLPVAKVAAYNTLGMGKGMKLFLRFNKPFWNASRLFDLITEGPTGICWTPAKYQPGAENDVMTCFSMGENAQFMTALPDDAARLKQVLSDLDAMFAGQASSNFEDGLVQDWSSEPYVRGSYSYPAPGSYPDGNDSARQVLAAPVGGKLFFAGEATHNEAPSTVPGAIQSGERAAAEIHSTLGGPGSASAASKGSHPR